jgi:hypothetical protein
MSTSIQRSVMKATEAALAHLVKISKMVDSKLVAEGVLYETIAQTLLGGTAEWVNHEHKVDVKKGKGIRLAGDNKRVDFALRDGGETHLIEIVVASRTTLKASVDVSNDMEKLFQGKPINSLVSGFGSASYLIVFNIRTELSHPNEPGSIRWNEPPSEDRVTFITSFMYKSKGFVRTAAIFRVLRSTAR